MLSLLLQHKRNASQEIVVDYQHVSEYAPFFEIDAHWTNGNELTSDIRKRHDCLGTRVFNTHLRFDMLPNSGGASLIYVIRSPLDTCVSFYHHLSHQVQGGYEGTFDEFFQEWISGDIAFGSWMDHILSFVIGISSGIPSTSNQVKLPDGRKMLLVSYQDMIDDLPRVVKDIQDFLELESITSRQRQEMLPTFEFANMKQNLDRFQPQSVQWKNNFSFLRKGVSGDFLTIVSEQQKKEFQDCIKRNMMKGLLSKLLKESHPHLYEMFESLVPK